MANKTQLKVREFQVNGRTVGLGLAEQVLLRRIGGGEAIEIPHHEKQLKGLFKHKLISHRFTQDEWPRALAVLTPAGQALLAQVNQS